MKTFFYIHVIFVVGFLCFLSVGISDLKKPFEISNLQEGVSFDGFYTFFAYLLFLWYDFDTIRFTCKAIEMYKCYVLVLFNFLSVQS